MDLGQGPAARGRRPTATTSTGIVTVTSEVRLPELQRFLAPEAFGRPTIRVRIGQMRRSPPSRTARWHTTATAARLTTATRRTTATGIRLNGTGPRRTGLADLVPTAPRRAASRYTEGLGGFGFGVEISQVGERIEVIAVAAAPALATRALHERGRADPALDVREQGLRARARGLLRGRRPRRSCSPPAPTPGRRPPR